jgi:RimJ/RimL family protein N-acetyltransferase
VIVSPDKRASVVIHGRIAAVHPMEPVELSGGVAVIEPLGVEHATGLLAAAEAEEVFAWLPYPRPQNLEEALAWIEGALADRDADRRFPFAVLDAEDRSVLGSTSYWDFDAHNAHVEIGSTWLRRAAWGTGRNAEAKLLLMSHAFETLGLERVAFRTDIRNERSQQAIERLGAVKEGIHRHEMRRRDGSWRDSVHYSILRSEWPNAKDRLRDRIAAARAV